MLNLLFNRVRKNLGSEKKSEEFDVYNMSISLLNF